MAVRDLAGRENGGEIVADENVGGVGAGVVDEGRLQDRVGVAGRTGLEITAGAPDGAAGGRGRTGVGTGALNRDAAGEVGLRGGVQADGIEDDGRRRPRMAVAQSAAAGCVAKSLV